MIRKALWVLFLAVVVLGCEPARKDGARPTPGPQVGQQGDIFEYKMSGNVRCYIYKFGDTPSCIVVPE